MDEKRVAEYRSPDGAFSFHVTEEPRYHELTQVGEMNLESARHLAAALVEISHRLGRRYPLLMPLPPEFSSVHADARRHMTERVLGATTPLSKWSVYGGSFALRTMFNLYVRVSNSPARLWETREQAVSWLEEA